MDEKLKKDIAAIVAEIFSDKEEAEMRKKTENALQDSADKVEGLTTSLEELTVTQEETLSTVATLETTVQDLESKLEAAEKEVEEANQKLAESESKMEEMNKDRAAELRMAELEISGVVSAGKELQTTKVREMSDEEFAAYKEELVSLRQAVVAELSKSVEKPEEKADEKEEAEEEGEEEAGEEEAGEEEEGTPPAEINPGNAISAALNMEVMPSKSLVAKYAELGKAMAANFK